MVVFLFFIFKIVIVLFFNFWIFWFLWFLIWYFIISVYVFCNFFLDNLVLINLGYLIFIFLVLRCGEYIKFIVFLVEVFVFFLVFRKFWKWFGLFFFFGSFLVDKYICCREGFLWLLWWLLCIFLVNGGCICFFLNLSLKVRCKFCKDGKLFVLVSILNVVFGYLFLLLLLWFDWLCCFLY